MQKFKFQIIALALSMGSWGAMAQKAKIPHLHDSKKGGTVLMMGDDHIEIRKGSKARTLELYPSNKFREPVEVNKYKMEVTLLEGALRHSLALKSSEESPFKVIAQLPEKISDSARIEVRVQRLTPVKGQVSTYNPQSISFSELEHLKPSPHAGHEM